MNFIVIHFHFVEILQSEKNQLIDPSRAVDTESETGMLDTEVYTSYVYRSIVLASYKQASVDV